MAPPKKKKMEDDEDYVDDKGYIEDEERPQQQQPAENTTIVFTERDFHGDLVDAGSKVHCHMHPRVVSFMRIPSEPSASASSPLRAQATMILPSSGRRTNFLHY